MGAVGVNVCVSPEKVEISEVEADLDAERDSLGEPLAEPRPLLADADALTLIVAAALAESEAVACDAVMTPLRLGSPPLLDGEREEPKDADAARLAVTVMLPLRDFAEDLLCAALSDGKALAAPLCEGGGVAESAGLAVPLSGALALAALPVALGERAAVGEADPPALPLAQPLADVEGAPEADALLDPDAEALLGALVLPLALPLARPLVDGESAAVEVSECGRVAAAVPEPHPDGGGDRDEVAHAEDEPHAERLGVGAALAET